MAKLSITSPLISVDWLQNRLGNQHLVLLDASIPPIAPFTRQTLPADLSARYLPGAMRFDYDQDVCDHNSSLPHMMPDAEFFTEQVQQLGINANSTIVIYDDTGVYASPRAWWMFKAMGHDDVAVLNGGAVAWYQAGLPMSEEISKSSARPGNFQAQENVGQFCDALMVYQLLNEESCTILDARSEGRFYGREPEPRDNLRGGHMPGACSMPFQQVLDDIYMKPVDELEEIFQKLADREQKLVFTCGSGLSACILTLAAELAGYRQLSVYDGSWCEWGQPGKLPVVC